jgi:hypothetical protein
VIPRLPSAIKQKETKLILHIPVPKYTTEYSQHYLQQLPIMADQAEVYEEQNVHEVYQQIAGHFSATRYKVS